MSPRKDLTAAPRNSDIGEISNDNGNGGSSTDESSYLQNLVPTLQKQLQNQSEQIEQISGVPPVIKRVDMNKYVQQPQKPSAAPIPFPKKFKMLDLPKYEGTLDPYDHVIVFTMGIKGNDLAKEEIELVLVKKFRETFTKGALT